MKVRLKTFDNLKHDVETVQRRVAARAHELFERRGGQWGRALDDWIRAEHDVAWRPPMDLVERGAELWITMALPGVDLAHLEVRLAPDVLVVTAPAPAIMVDGTAHVRELPIRSIARTVTLPLRVQPDTARAEYRDGVLRLTVLKTVDAALTVAVTAEPVGASVAESKDAEC